MRVLITNDDGYQAPGLIAHANRMVAAGHEVIVAAPQRQQSGGSAALGRVIDGASIAWERFTSPEMPGIAWGVTIDAPPALSVKAVLSGAFGPVPDIVLSGINRGWNTGGSTLHSGTLGAAMTACSLGWRAAAISCAKPPNDNLETAAEVAVAVAETLREWPTPVALNVNVPNLAVAELKGVREAPVGPQGLLDVDVELVGDDLRFKLVHRQPAADSDCDARAILDGYVAVSVLDGRYGQQVHTATRTLEDAITTGLGSR
jgi:5'-nucleotidase